MWRQCHAGSIFRSFQTFVSSRVICTADFQFSQCSKARLVQRPAYGNGSRCSFKQPRRACENPVVLEAHLGGFLKWEVPQ
jgi:hypothetical protein